MLKFVFLVFSLLLLQFKIILITTLLLSLWLIVFTNLCQCQNLLLRQ